jgi:hypothetical protein
MMAGVGLADAQSTTVPDATTDGVRAIVAANEDYEWVDGELGPPSGSEYFNNPNDDPDQGEPQADPTQQQPSPSLFPGLALPFSDQLSQVRQRALAQYGITFGASYQQLFQYSTATVPRAAYDTALGAWAATSVTWAPLDRGGDYQGTFVFRWAFRASLGDNAVPAVFGPADQGSLWSNYEFTSWNQGARVEDLFWEQRIGPQLSIRIGNMGPQAVFNFFRFKDARTGFTASPFAFNETIPYPTFGFGASFRWLPALPSVPDVYVVGTINDMNGDPAALGIDWGTVRFGQFFYGLEIGKDWRRENGEFDHVHIDLFYADNRSTRNPETTPNVAGGGFKIAGEKQFGPWVAFANYTYNTAEGGGISTTFSRDMATTGLAYLRPLGVQGEIAAGAVWGQSFANLFAPGMPAKNQYGGEAYWNMLVTPNLTFTPGIQLIWNLAFNPTAHFAAIPSVKFRAFF